MKQILLSLVISATIFFLSFFLNKVPNEVPKKEALTHRVKASPMQNNSQWDWQLNRIGIISCPRRLLLVGRCSICRSRPVSCNRLQSREYFLLARRAGAVKKHRIRSSLKCHLSTKSLPSGYYNIRILCWS